MSCGESPSAGWVGAEEDVDLVVEDDVEDEGVDGEEVGALAVHFVLDPSGGAGKCLNSALTVESDAEELKGSKEQVW